MDGLLASAAGGSTSGLAGLYDATVADAFALAHARTGCPDAAATAVHDGFLDVWRTAGERRPAWMSARAWVLARVDARARTAGSTA